MVRNDASMMKMTVNSPVAVHYALSVFAISV